MNEILDFTDYAKPLDFKFRDNTYRIPAFNKSQIETLMKINAKFVADEIDSDITSEDDQKMTKEQLDKTGDYFNMQDEFLASAVFKKVDEEYIQITEEELSEWPIKVKNAVMRSVSQQMATTVEDDEPEKK